MNYNSIFLSNKYTNWYYQIINFPTNSDQFEVHHIIPKSCGGSDNPDNLVKLSFRQHYVAHLLLTKMTTGTHKAKMIFALRCMTNFDVYKRRYKPSSHLIELQKKLIRETPISETHSANIRAGQLGKKLSEAHKTAISNGSKGRQHSEETKAKISSGNKGKALPLEQREKISNSHKGKTISELHRQKLSASLKGKKRDSLFRNKMKAAMLQFSYTIKFPDGTEETVLNLKDWCKLHNFSYSSCSSVSRVGGFYKEIYISRSEI